MHRRSGRHGVRAGRRRRRPALAAAALAVFAALQRGSTSAQEPAPLALEEAERRALQASPAVRAAEARVRAEQGRLRQAGLYPNPDLTLDTLRFTHGFGPKETSLSLRQPIPYHGKRALERREAEALIEAARKDGERVRLDLQQEVREAYCRIYFTARIVEVEQEDVETTKDLGRAAEARVKAGDAPPLESLKATVEVSRAASELGRARGELAAQTASFNLLLGLAADAQTIVAAPPTGLAPPDPLPDLMRRALERQPGIKARESLAAAAQAASERARLERRPDVAIGPTFGSEEGTPFVGAGIALRLPAWNRNQGNILAAEAARDEAAALAGAARLEVERLVADAYGRFRSATSQQVLYEEGLLAEAEQLLETARKSYEGGESGVLELLDARRTTLAVRQGYYRTCLDAAVAAIQLRRAVGEGAEAPR